MNILRYIYITVLLALPLPGMAQDMVKREKSALRFEREEWDFGRIKEEAGSVSCIFRFTNTGRSAIVIERVGASCGCTTPSYPKKPVKPGERGEIKVTFDPSDRPGAFSKDVYVVSGEGVNYDRLTVKGEVIPRPRTVEEDYPYKMGTAMRFNTLSANYRYVAHGVPKSMVIGYANTSDKDVRLAFGTEPDNGDIYVDAPSAICAGCRGDITVTYHVQAGSKTYGRQASRIYPVIDGKRQAMSFSVNAIVTDDFTGVDEVKAPRMTIDPYFFHFGDVKRGAKRNKVFTISNGGKSVLVIRSVEARKGMATTLKPGTEIASGKSIEFTCTLDTSDTEKGVVSALVSITTNDPSRPLRDVRLAANVQ